VSKLGKEISSHEPKTGELSIHGVSQNGDAHNAGSQQSLSAVSVPSSVPVPSKMEVQCLLLAKAVTYLLML